MELDGVVSELTSLLISNACNNPVTLIAHAMEIVAKHFPTTDTNAKKEMVMKVIKVVAAGADGIEGTNDDLISSYTVSKLKVLLECDLVDNVTDTLIGLTEGKVSVGKLSSIMESEAATLAVDEITTVLDDTAAKVGVSTETIDAAIKLVGSHTSLLKPLVNKLRSLCCAAKPDKVE